MVAKRRHDVVCAARASARENNCKKMRNERFIRTAVHTRLIIHRYATVIDRRGVSKECTPQKCRITSCSVQEPIVLNCTVDLGYSRGVRNNIFTWPAEYYLYREKQCNTISVDNIMYSAKRRYYIIVMYIRWDVLYAQNTLL